jgi:hypothetical protein
MYKLYQKQSKAELKLIAEMFSNRLSQLSFDAKIMQFMGDKRYQKLKLVKWADLQYHPDQYRLQVDSLTLPRGRGITEKSMMQDDVIMALSATAQKPVAVNWVNGVGLWFLIDREHGIGNIPKFVDYDMIIQNTSASKMSVTQIPIGFSSNRKVEYLDFSADTQAHLIIGGTTGGGKSSLLHLIICHLIQYDPAAVKLALFDFKRVELRPFYGSVPHLMHEVVTDPTAFIDYISAIRDEVERRYTIMEQAKVQHIKEYNAKRDPANRLPEIFVIVDELASIFTNPETKSQRDDIEAMLGNIAMQARACGVHLILSTQRPDAKILTGYIRACVPCKVAYACASVTESIVVIDNGQAAFKEQVPVGRAIMAKGRFHIPFQTAWLTKRRRQEIIDKVGNAETAPLLRAQRPVKFAEMTISIQELARYALDELGGYFSRDKLHARFSNEGATKNGIEQALNYHKETPFELDGELYIIVGSRKNRRAGNRIVKYFDNLSIGNGSTNDDDATCKLANIQDEIEL